jgi:hypothetical protein
MSGDQDSFGSMQTDSDQLEARTRSLIAEEGLSWTVAWRRAEAELGLRPSIRYKGWLVGGFVLLLLAALVAIVGLAEARGGIPGYYEEGNGTVVVGGVDTIIRFEDISGSEVQFEAILVAEEGESFTVFYDPADAAATAVTPAGQAELVLTLFIVAAFLGGVAAALGGVAASRYYRYRGSAVD